MSKQKPLSKCCNERTKELIAYDRNGKPTGNIYENSELLTTSNEQE